MPLFESDRSNETLPLSVITGFLGSGKTTLLNALLKHPGMADSAVVINEFGEEPIDHALVEAAKEDVAVLASGCVCCSLRGDLTRALRGLFIARQRAELPQFRRILVETTGLADPGPILQTVLTDPLIARFFHLDATIATVDALHGMGQLDAHDEAVKQAAMADRLILTKTDLAPSGIEALEARLRRLNSIAPVHKAVRGAIDPALLFGAGPIDPKTKSIQIEAWLGHDHTPGEDHHHHHHHHDNRIRSFVLAFDQPLDWTVVGEWLAALAQGVGANLLRVKGVLDLIGEDKPVVIHGIHHVFHPPTTLPVWPEGKRRSRLVFIVRDLDREMIEASYRGFAEAGA
ncbi:MAG: GTP-binding protein [Alphaproteobacteria bacterium]|nr:GTP-binding protein [Alphaproteobacteria bacterium]